MALKMLINMKGNFVTCMKNTRHGKEVANFILTIPDMVWARFYTQQFSYAQTKVHVENLNLVTNLEQMGVDLTQIRKRHAVLLRKTITYEQELKQFLTGKGADDQMVASMISRFPKVITRNCEVLDEMWNIWKGVLEVDAKILNVAQRSPEAFFRTSNSENLRENIRYLQSINLPPNILNQMMAKSPRTFANSVDLNKQIIEYLFGLCTQLGGNNPMEFVRKLISRNIFILTKSINRIQSNVVIMKSLMKLNDRAVLLWMQCDGALLLSLSYNYFEKNYRNVQEVLQSLGARESDISCYVYLCPKVLLVTPQLFARKVSLLMECDVDVKDILNTLNILGVHIDTLVCRIKVLKDYGYDFCFFGIGILSLSQTQFAQKLERLHSAGLLKKSVGGS